MVSAVLARSPPFGLVISVVLIPGKSRSRHLAVSVRPAGAEWKGPDSPSWEMDISAQSELRYSDIGRTSSVGRVVGHKSRSGR
jgi:hypothetical protein